MKPLMVVLLLAAPQVAHAGTPPSLKSFLDYGRYYSYDAAKKEWKFEGDASVSCDTSVKEATEAGVEDTLSVDVPFDTPDWKRGPHTFKELKDYCARAKKSEAVYKLMGWAKTATDDDQGDLAATCIKFYNQLTTEYGLVPDTKIPYEGVSIVDPATGNPYVGTIEGARKKFCDPKAKKYLDAIAAEEAPYRKVLQADKLAVAIGNISKAIYSAGRKELKTPADLAKSNLWFRVVSYNDQYCKHGADVKYVVYRYQFDAKQKLVKQTSENFCGNPPSSALR
jgi:hypothetical protein